MTRIYLGSVPFSALDTVTGPLTKEKVIELLDVHGMPYMLAPEAIGPRLPELPPPYDPFDCEEFDALMYAYRTAPPHEPDVVVAAFEAVKTYCRLFVEES